MLQVHVALWLPVNTMNHGIHSNRACNDSWFWVARAASECWIKTIGVIVSDRLDLKLAFFPSSKPFTHVEPCEGHKVINYHYVYGEGPDWKHSSSIIICAWHVWPPHGWVQPLSRKGSAWLQCLRKSRSRGRECAAGGGLCEREREREGEQGQRGMQTLNKNPSLENPPSHVKIGSKPGPHQVWGLGFQGVSGPEG